MRESCYCSGEGHGFETHWDYDIIFCISVVSFCGYKRMRDAMCVFAFGGRCGLVVPAVSNWDKVGIERISK